MKQEDLKIIDSRVYYRNKNYFDYQSNFNYCPVVVEKTCNKFYRNLVVPAIKTLSSSQRKSLLFIIDQFIQINTDIYEGLKIIKLSSRSFNETKSFLMTHGKLDSLYINGNNRFRDIKIKYVEDKVIRLGNENIDFSIIKCRSDYNYKKSICSSLYSRWIDNKLLLHTHKAEILYIYAQHKLNKLKGLVNKYNHV